MSIHKSAFTLIELIVVVSIIALLVGLLLPALAGARNSARQMQSMSNLRSIGQAMEIYLSLYDEYYFPNHPPEGVHLHTHEIEWSRRLARAVAQFDRSAVMHSPLDPYRDYEVVDDEGGRMPLVSYAINGYFEVAGANRRRLLQPGRIITHANRADVDSHGDPISNGMAADALHLAFHPWEHAHWWEDVAADRNRGQADYLFADGHVELLSEDALTEAMANPPQFDRGGEHHH